MEFKLWLESSLGELRQSAIDAFPHTTKRQHIVNTVVLDNIQFFPLDTNALLIRAKAHGEKTYSPSILVPDVNFSNSKTLKNLEIKGKFVEQISIQNKDVKILCDCADYFWRFHHYNHPDSLIGKDRTPYVSQGGEPANPLEMEGCCKHIMKLVEELKLMKLFKN